MQKGERIADDLSTIMEAFDGSAGGPALLRGAARQLDRLAGDHPRCLPKRSPALIARSSMPTMPKPSCMTRRALEYDPDPAPAAGTGCSNCAQWRASMASSPTSWRADGRPRRAARRDRRRQRGACPAQAAGRRKCRPPTPMPRPHCQISAARPQRGSMRQWPANWRRSSSMRRARTLVERLPASVGVRTASTTSNF